MGVLNAQTQGRLTTGSGTMKLVEALIRAGTFFDLIVMPGMIHEIHGVDLAYWFDAEARSLTEHLITRPARISTMVAIR